MGVIAFPSDGLSSRDIALLTDEGYRHGCRVEELVDDNGAVSAALLSHEVVWHVTRQRGRYAVHSEFSELLAEGIVLTDVLRRAFVPARRATGPSGPGAA